jgi:hypothetical protein
VKWVAAVAVLRGVGCRVCQGCAVCGGVMFGAKTFLLQSSTSCLHAMKKTHSRAVPAPQTLKVYPSSFCVAYCHSHCKSSVWCLEGMSSMSIIFWRNACISFYSCCASCYLLLLKMALSSLNNSTQILICSSVGRYLIRYS